jgi:translation initiation factor IF-3
LASWLLFGVVDVGPALRAGPFLLKRPGWSLHETPCLGGSISAEPRINDRIRVPEVRLVGPNGEQVGIVAIGIALQMAQESDLDLVEVAPMARPPVAKLMDYGKFKYETAQKARESRKNQVLTVIKEMKLRPKIDPHDYETKKGHVVRFLKAGDKVKITIMFRGREQSRPELGFRLLQRLGEDVSELGFVESSPKQDGRNMIMVLAPHKNAADLKKIAADQKAAEGGRAGQAHVDGHTPETSETPQVSETPQTPETPETPPTEDVTIPVPELDATDGTPSVETDS